MAVSTLNRDPAAETDGELVQAVQAAGATAWGRAAAEELFARYRKRVYAFCFRYVKSHEQALDASQDVLLTAYERLNTFGGRSEFSSWLFAIARNRCLNLLRSVSYWREDEADLDQIPSGGLRPDRQLEEQEDEERMLGLMKEVLEPVEQRAIYLRCFEKLPVEEITRLLGIESASGARAVLQKARRKLREALGGR